MQKLTLEYPLNARSPKIVWDMISNAAGLQKWLADKVTEDEETMTFTWGNPWTERDTKQSRIINKEKFNHIRMLWDYHEDTPETRRANCRCILPTLPLMMRKRPTCAASGMTIWNGCIVSAACN